MTAYCYDATYYVISNLCAHSDYTTYSVPRQLLDNGYATMNLVVDGYGTTTGVTGALNLSYGMVGAGDYQVPYLHGQEVRQSYPASLIPFFMLRSPSPYWGCRRSSAATASRACASPS
jgi:hypothetical protein